MKIKIIIIPLGIVEPVVTEHIKNSIRIAFDANIEIMPALANPDYAFEPRRKQYFSTKILDRLPQSITEECKETNQITKILGITNVDLATPVLTFVFGEAQLNGICAVISLARLKQEFYELIPNQKILLDRVVKEAIHELGHTFGLLHCDNNECVMHFSPMITAIDQKDVNFCTSCLVYLQKEI